MKMNTIIIIVHFQKQEKNFENFGTQPANVGTRSFMNPKKNINNLKTYKMDNLISNWDFEKCLHFLSENYGFRGVNGTGLTKKPKNRTLENMRKECLIQSKLL